MCVLCEGGSAGRHGNWGEGQPDGALRQFELLSRGVSFEFPSADMSRAAWACVRLSGVVVWCCCACLVAASWCTHLAPMVLPAKLQASILSWVGESWELPSEPAAAAAAAETTAAAAAAGQQQQEECCCYPLLTPADLFSLSSKGVAAGSPGLVVKDGFLGREQALRCYEGEFYMFCYCFIITGFCT